VLVLQAVATKCKLFLREHTLTRFVCRECFWSHCRVNVKSVKMLVSCVAKRERRVLQTTSVLCHVLKNDIVLCRVFITHLKLHGMLLSAIAKQSVKAQNSQSRNSGISAWAARSLFCLEGIPGKQTRLFRYSLDRAQRERELENLKRTLESESKSFEEQLQQARQKHTQQSDQFQDEIDQLKRVRQPCVVLLVGEDHCVIEQFLPFFLKSSASTVGKKN